MKCHLNKTKISVYIGVLFCVAVYIDSSRNNIIVVSDASRASENIRVTETLEQCHTLITQISDGSYPFPETQYPVSGLLTPPPLDNVRVSEQHQVAVCVPYKAGSETWRYLLRTLNNVSNHEMSGDSVRSWDQIRDYHHVIQVREPYERLLSAYRFTFQNSKG